MIKKGILEKHKQEMRRWRLAKKEIPEKARKIAEKKLKEPLNVIFDRDSCLLLKKINGELLKFWCDDIFNSDIWVSGEKEKIYKKKDKIQEGLRRINHKLITLNRQREKKLDSIAKREKDILWHEFHIKEKQKSMDFKGGRY